MKIVCSLCSGAGRATGCGKARRAFREGVKATWEPTCSLCDFSRDNACPTCPECNGTGVTEDCKCASH